MSPNEMLYAMSVVNVCLSCGAMVFFAVVYKQSCYHKPEDKRGRFLLIFNFGMSVLANALQIHVVIPGHFQ